MANLLSFICYFWSNWPLIPFVQICCILFFFWTDCCMLLDCCYLWTSYNRLGNWPSDFFLSYSHPTFLFIQFLNSLFSGWFNYKCFYVTCRRRICFLCLWGAISLGIYFNTWGTYVRRLLYYICLLYLLLNSVFIYIVFKCVFVFIYFFNFQTASVKLGSIRKVFIREGFNFGFGLAVWILLTCW